MTLDKLTEAKKMLADARAKAPKSMRLALAAGKVEAALGNKAVAETTLKEAITLNETGDPLAIQPYLVLAELLAGEGKVDEAQKALDDARAKLPDSLEMQRALGDVAAAQGHFDQAVTHYQAAMAKDPKDLRTHYRYAITLRKMGKGDEASAELDQVAAGDKDYPGLALERGLLFEETGQSDKALDMFQNALKKSPNDPDLQLRVGAAYVASNHPDEAIAMLKKVLELRTNSAEANHYMGRAYLEKGALHAGEASKFLRRAVDLDPNRAEYHLYIAWQANDAEPPELGIVQAEVTKALSLDATLADAYWQRGVLERKTLRIDDAIKDLKHALELKPSRYQAHATLAECYEEKNQDPLALGEWQKAVAGNDEVPYWRYKLGKLKAIHGDVASAADDLLYATTEAEKLSAHPGWLADAEYMAGSAAQKAGKKSDAIQHYGTFLGMAPLTSPDRKDAIRQLAALGSPWNE
jgi:tetratricopeptide (TPR) repeat protein